MKTPFGRDFRRSMILHLIFAAVVTAPTVLFVQWIEQQQVMQHSEKVTQEQSTVDEWVSAIKSAEQDVNAARTEYDSYVSSHSETADNITVENFIMDKLAQRQTVCQHLINSYTDMTKTLPSYINYQIVYLKDCSGK